MVFCGGPVHGKWHNDLKAAYRMIGFGNSERMREANQLVHRKKERNGQTSSPLDMETKSALRMGEVCKERSMAEEEDRSDQKNKGVVEKVEDNTNRVKDFFAEKMDQTGETAKNVSETLKKIVVSD